MRENGNKNYLILILILICLFYFNWCDFDVFSIKTGFQINLNSFIFPPLLISGSHWGDCQEMGADWLFNFGQSHLHGAGSTGWQGILPGACSAVGAIGEPGYEGERIGFR